MKIARWHLNKIAIILAVFHWLITFASDRLIFTYQLFDFTNVTTIAKSSLAWGSKFVFLLFLVLFWQCIAYVVVEWKKKNKEVQSYFYYTGIYFLIMLVLFFNLMPGLWRLDEFSILRNALNIIPHFWQGYLTSVFYIIALMLVPNASGVVFVQIGVISLIVGYIIYQCSRMLQKKRLVYLLYIPFLLFPVIDSNFYPIRMSIYAFLELLFVFELYIIKSEQREMKTKNILLLALLAGILVCWRTEAIYYMISAPLTFVVLFYQETSKKQKLQFTIATIGISILLTSVQLLGNKLDSGNEYDITSVVLPITPLVYTAYEMGDTEALKAIDQVLNTQILLEGYQQKKTGIQIFWSEPTLIKTDYTTAEYSAFKSAYYQLIMKYPGVFLKERFDTYLGSIGVLNDTENLYVEDSEHADYIKFRNTYGYPTEPRFRSLIIKQLEFADSRKIHDVVYSVVPSTILLVGACILLLVRRKWGYFLLLANVCAKIPLIFLTAPSRLFMYYYSVYLIGAVLVGVGIVFIIDKKCVKITQ